jgi:hypothetical protein
MTAYMCSLKKNHKKKSALVWNCVTMGRTAKETYKLLQVSFYNKALNQQTASEWYKYFKHGQELWKEKLSF